MPDDHKDIFELQNPDIWILLKIKSRVWPVHVINNRMQACWEEFYFANNLKRGFRVIFGL